VTALLLMLACSDGDSGETAAPFEDTLTPDDLHVLVSSLTFLDGHALVELRTDLSTAWTGDVDPETGAQGADRLDDGATVFAHVAAPPDYRSSFDLMDADGGIAWSYDQLATVGFSHGIQATGGGDFIALDTVAGYILSFDADGTELWRQAVSDDGEVYRPNGLQILEQSDGSALIGVSELERSGDGSPDMLALYQLDARDVAPTRLWRVPVADSQGDGAWPHGPRVQDDGTVLLCHASSGQIVAYDQEDGAELWRVPDNDEAPRFGFPRDVLTLPDGSLLVADAASEVIRIADPLGEARVVGAVETPGVFGLTPIQCGAGGGLPCLGSD